MDQGINPNSKFPKEIINLVLDMINHMLYIHNKSSNLKLHNFFLKIYFQGKDIEKLKLNKILAKHLKIIPKKLNFSKPKIIYTRSKTIGSTIFNYKK